MSSQATPATGLSELEKELVCSICTETLYQPLTLLDCLHTFCGSCLKEWFSSEYGKARSSASRSHPYSCPTCRAQVKDARRNATVNTLLEMFLAADASRGKSEQEKADIAKSYQPGENIMPKVDKEAGRKSRRREAEERAEEQADRRQVEEARERSIRETRGTSAQTSTYLAAPSASDRRASRSRSRESRDDRDRRRRDEERMDERRERRRRLEAAENQIRDRDPPTSISGPSAPLTVENLAAAQSPSSVRHPAAVENRIRERQLIPQTSLRSLVSVSESGVGTGDSAELEQIIQELISEGFLEGLDLKNLTLAEEARLTARIGDAHEQRRRAAAARMPIAGLEPGVGSSQERHRVRERQPVPEQRHQRSRSTHYTETETTRRPTEERLATRSRPLESDSAGRRRRGSDTVGRSSPLISRTADLRPGENQGSRSAIDLSNSPGSTEIRAEAHRPSDRRSVTEPEQSLSVTERWRRAKRSDSAGTSQAINAPIPVSESDLSPSRSVEVSRQANNRPGLLSRPTPPCDTVGDHNAQPAQQPIPNSSGVQVACLVCSRPSIQFELYKHCSACSIDVCLRCYRTDPSKIRPCPILPLISPPYKSHNFIGRKFLPVQTQPSYPLSPRNTRPPELLEGRFCDMCESLELECYWSCNTCAYGDWGFCDACVNSHRCCTHPLLPRAHKDHLPQKPTLRLADPPDLASGTITLPPSTLDASVARRPLTDSQTYVPLDVYAQCDICTQSIDPGSSRYHCPSHPSPSSTPSTITTTTTTGDYDICTPCYNMLVKTRRIRRDDGPAGWRRCPQGHRMIVVAIEPFPDGLRRVVQADLVGGFRDPFTNDAHHLTSTPNRAPPVAGTARYTWFPEKGDGGSEELLFPFYAEIEEIEEAREANPEWVQGVYAGRKGWFPAKYVDKHS